MGKFMITAIASLLLTPALAHSFECESHWSDQSLDNVLCISLPSDAPETNLPLAQTASSQAPVRMLTAKDQSGGDAVSEMRMLTPEERVSSLRPEALAEAIRVQEQIRSLDVFFKSGAAARGDLRDVTTAGKRDEAK
jgi:hypothetical protein